MGLLTPPHVTRAFVSARRDQQADPLRSRFACIHDQAGHDGLGPLAGILAAQAAHPEVAWLVLACDLPFLDRATLLHLIAERQPARLATAYRSTSDAAPEPLCAIYEPASRQPLLAYLERGKKSCPRGFLQRSDVALLDQPCWSALTNVNTMAEHSSAMQRLGEHPKARPVVSSSKLISIQYFAALREQAGLPEERVQTRAHTPAELYAELRESHRFSLPIESLRVAVNNEFGDWAQPLADGDVVVFLPPVAGG
jgi:molybdopterin-guanine dinucleotide biosynthesis protein A